MASGDTDNQTKVVVVMVPFIAHGHLNQLLHLSNLVSSYNIPVHFICTTSTLHQARSRLPGLATSDPMIHFHQFETPSFTSPPPDPTNHFPSHLQSSFESTLHLRSPVFDLICSVSKTATRVAVIHDALMSYVVQDIKSISNAECYNFRPLSVFYTFWDLWEKAGRPFEVDMELFKKLPSQNGIVSAEFRLFAKLQHPHMNNDVGDLFDSSRVIEGEFLEYLEREEISGKKKIWAVGPVNPVHTSDVTVLVGKNQNRHKCLQWLDKQPVNSVIYISFGTTTTFTNDQIRELAIGLERSEQKFIWVVRAADVVDMVGLKDRMVTLPDGFEERVKGKGFIERGWAPQLEILDHSATGGFMSHCGWNSSMESISMGVPMATWPMHSDQPRNAVLITEVLKVGVVVKDWERRNELVTALAVEKAVRTLMGSRQGDEMRKRAAKFGDDIKLSMIEGGASRLEMDSFISYIRR